MEDVEKQRLEGVGIALHIVEREYLEWPDADGIVDVVEHRRIPSASDPLLQSHCERSRQQSGKGREPTLVSLEDVQALDRFVELTILCFGQEAGITPFQQHPRKRVEEMQVLGRVG